MVGSVQTIAAWQGCSIVTDTGSGNAAWGTAAGRGEHLPQLPSLMGSLQQRQQQQQQQAEQMLPVLSPQQVRSALVRQLSAVHTQLGGLLASLAQQAGASDDAAAAPESKRPSLAVPSPAAKRVRWQDGQATYDGCAALPSALNNCSTFAKHAEWEAQLQDLGSFENGDVSSGGSSSLAKAELQGHLHAIARVQHGASREEQQEAVGRLVAAVLQGPSLSLFGELYLPWLVTASKVRLARECSTFACYLGLLQAGMDWRAVHRLMLGYLQGMLRRMLGASPLVSPAAADATEEHQWREQQEHEQAASPAATPPPLPDTGAAARPAHHAIAEGWASLADMHAHGEGSGSSSSDGD